MLRGGHPSRSLAALPVVLLLACGPGSSEGEGARESASRSGGAEAVENFALLDHTGRHHELHYHSDASAIVLFVQGNGCPIVRNTLPTLHDLRDRFAPRGVVFLGINANVQDDREAVTREAADFDIAFPILIDAAGLVARSLELTRTAEVLLIDPRGWRIVYRGPVDDRLDYEVQRSEARQRYLETALEQLLAGERVDVEPGPLKGCLISIAGNGAATPDYVADVAPILERRCLRCHREGGIAPWAMTHYQRVRGWAPMIREVIRTGRMPPWQADPHVGHFSNSLALSEDEAATLVAWAEGGAPRGEGEDPLLHVAGAGPEWRLGEPDLVLDVPEQSIPATGVVEYRYETVSVPVKEDRWVRAADLRPRNAAVLHHSLASITYPERLAHLQPRRGPLWSLFAGYSPGHEALPWPPGTGFFLPKGSELTFQLHYTTTGRAEVDAPRLGLYFHARPPRRLLKVGTLINRHFRIPPGVKEHRVRADRRFRQDVVLYEIVPHMHYRGRWAKLEAFYPDGTRELLLSVPRYDFNWQHRYRLSEPKTLPAGTRVVYRGAFDNSAENRANPDPTREVRWGLRSVDEMFIGWLLYADV